MRRETAKLILPYDRSEKENHGRRSDRFIITLVFITLEPRYAIMMRPSKTETAVHVCWLLRSYFHFLYEATGFNSRLSVHVCGFEITFLALILSSQTTSHNHTISGRSQDFSKEGGGGGNPVSSRGSASMPPEYCRFTKTRGTTGTQ